MVVPALLYVSIVGVSSGAARGWAVPTATDIAFAVAVLAIIGSHLPSALRIFLLTLAVVDDLIAIGIIAIFDTSSIGVVSLVLALLVTAVYGAIAQRFRRLFHARPTAAWVILVPLGAVSWALMHASGVHATIAGVLLGFTIPVLQRKADRSDDAGPGDRHRRGRSARGIGFTVSLLIVELGFGEGSPHYAHGKVAVLSASVIAALLAALVLGLRNRRHRTATMSGH